MWEDFRPGLAAARIQLRSLQPGNQKTTCPQCSHLRRKKTEPCLSVTITPAGEAKWQCHHCGWTGGAGGEARSPRHHREVKLFNRPVRIENPQRPDSLLAWFQKRGIGAATVEKLGIYRTSHFFPQLGGQAECIAFPYEWAGVLRNVKYRDSAKNFVQEKQPEPVLFNADSIRPGEDLVFVEGEMDVAAMIEAGIACGVVSLPNGAPDKPEQSDARYAPLETHADQLEAAGRILIATDMDGPGELLANELARRLGKDRCWRVRFPSAGDVQTKDANDCLIEHGAEVLRECVAHAEAWPIDGLYTTDAFEDRVWEMFHGNGPQPLSAGMGDDFDRAFKVLPGQFVVVTGIPNHGKSRFLDQIAVNMSTLHGWRWGVFSPETGTENHIVDLCEIACGYPFHPGPSFRMSDGQLRDTLKWVHGRFVFIDAADHTPSIDWVLERAKAAVLRHGINGLVVDPYNELEASRPPNMTETEFVSQLISKCKRFAKVHDVTVFVVAHPTKISNQGQPGGKEPIPGLYDIAGSAHWRNKADAGLVVYRDYDAGETIAMSKKIRRQPICGEPGSVKFSFLGDERRFEAQKGSYAMHGSAKPTPSNSNGKSGGLKYPKVAVGDEPRF